MSNKRPSRLSVAYIYFKRIIRWHRNKSPYISGDCFADISDFVYKAPKFRGRGSEIESAEVIFCRSHDLQELFNLFGDKITASVVMTGNSDFEFHALPTNIPKSVKVLFLQNSYISDNKFIFTLPIGVENFRLGVNGNPKHFKVRRPDKKRRAKILIGPFSPTHPVRESLLNNFPISNNIVDVLRDRIKPSRYDKLVRRYSAVAAVRGNGVDTHRLWESLYRGISPIVEFDQWWRSLEAYFPDVIVINEWNTNEMASALERSKAAYFDPRSVKPLWMPFWEEKISSYLNSNSLPVAPK